MENIISSSHCDQPIELWLGLLYEDPNTQVQATPGQVVMAQYDQPEAEVLL